MNADKERELFHTLGRIEGHLEAINGRQEDCANFREQQPKDCEAHRKSLWKAVTNLKVVVAVLASGGTLAAGVMKWLGIW